MGFLGNLAKGFVRSAVNQVGRDTGKVVSNQLYGDAHATPIRNVNKTSKGIYLDDEGVVINPIELREKAENDGWKPKYSSHQTSYKWFSRIFCFLVWLGLGIILYPFSIALPIIPIIICIVGVTKIFARNVVWEREGTIYIQKSDRRYKGGYRIESQYGSEKVKLPCNEKDRKLLLIHGIADFLIAAALYIGANYWGIQLDRDTKIKEYNTFLNDTTNLKQDIEYWKDKDTTIYNRQLREFNEKYNKALEYIKNNEPIQNLKQK